MLPRLLIFDDLFGRNVPNGRNADRENLCAHFLWQDATSDAASKTSRQKVLRPTAEAFFCRAQLPVCAHIRDTVENDLELALDAIRGRWSVHSKPKVKRKVHSPAPCWSMVLIDLCFYTGMVTEESHRRTPGMPEGRPSDDNPSSYFGLALLDAIHREFPELPVFILSSKPREEVSLEFSRRGALGFIDRSDVRGPELLAEALWNHGLLPDPEGEVVGNSIPLLLALREARRAASHRENVLIRGARGCGKELLAGYLHRASQKPENKAVPFVTVNSAVFTPNLFASELFGIQPKTATGVDAKVGLIEMAKGGDLFLDEIADMPPEVQAAMLRVLQERQITRVGGRQTIPLDVRFISATNADIESPELNFRPDLLDRLRLGSTIWLPPLRDRREDIPLLVEKFVREAEAVRPGIKRREIEPSAMETLVAHEWPGNIRELRSVVFDAVNRHPDVEHLVSKHLRISGRDADAHGLKSTTSDKNLLSANSRIGSEPTDSAKAAKAVDSLDALLHQMAGFGFDPLKIGEWASRLSEVQHQQNGLIARMLQAALQATKRRTPDCPNGVIQIHPAAKLVTGNSSLTASKAADLFKRLLGPTASELEGDLREAYKTAVRLRPKSSNITGRKSGEAKP